MILMIDHEDSFTYNIVHYVEKLGYTIQIKQAARITIEEIVQLNPSGIILSPGPGKPEDQHTAIAILERLAGKLPILGVCLGFQVIIHHFGGKIHQLQPVHGHIALVEHNEQDIFHNIRNPVSTARYHSLGITTTDVLPEGLEVTARSDEIIMGIKHAAYPIYGIQFHPESILTEEGDKMIHNFLKMTAGVHHES